MKFFVLTNPNSLLNTRPCNDNSQTPLRSRGFPLQPPTIGPKRPKNCHPKSKNCANRKKTARKQREKEIKAAQAQIHQLDRQLALLIDRQLHRSAQDAAYLTLKLYFHNIESGINPTKFPSQAQAAKDFVLSRFDSQLKSPDYTGLDQFLQQWQLLSECHESIKCQVSSIKVYPFTDEEKVNVVKTYGITTLQISRTTIERVFPSILNDEELVQWLIGKKYSFSYHFVAYVDVRTGLVFQIESKIDLTSALLDLLHDPFATVKMVEASKMTTHGNLLLTSAVRENQNVIEKGFL